MAEYIVNSNSEIANIEDSDVLVRDTTTYVKGANVYRKGYTKAIKTSSSQVRIYTPPREEGIM